ncbi:MAG: hypothetical protein Q7J82_03165 [Coriobacteriia bacterium]|nr:hypothetical protein [Coriobacteriia bacterium]
MKTLRLVIQYLLAIVSWVIFALLWAWVFWEGPAVDELLTVGYILLVSFGIVVLMAIWVRYNVGIYRRKGARKTVPVATYDYSTDRLGKTVRLDIDVLRNERMISVTIENGEKCYVAMRADDPATVSDV